MIIIKKINKINKIMLIILIKLNVSTFQSNIKLKT